MFTIVYFENVLSEQAFAIITMYNFLNILYLMSI